MKLTPREPTPEIYNPWRESLENCISGDNYLRAQEYRDLIEELDDLYRLRAMHEAAPSVPSVEQELLDLLEDARDYPGDPYVAQRINDAIARAPSEKGE